MFKDTEMLIERCIRREDKAWEEFIERFSGLLFYSARERLRRGGFSFSQQDIEDVVQAVFLEIWGKGLLEQVRERKKITAWLSIVAQTRALNHMRQKKERLLHEEESYKIDNIAASNLDESVMLELERAIKGFESRERIILKMSIIHGKRHEDIARFMKLPVNTVSTIIARRKKALKKFFIG